MKMIENSECQIAFGEYIKRGREKKGYTQTEIAEQLGVTQSYYSKIESGTRNLDFVVALKICSLLNLNMMEFVSQYIE